MSTQKKMPSSTGEQQSDLGWLQCTQCGYGHEVTREEVEIGDYTDRQACPSCCIGPCRIRFEGRVT